MMSKPFKKCSAGTKPRRIGGRSAAETRSAMRKSTRMFRFLVATTTASTLTTRMTRTHHTLILFRKTSLLIVATKAHCSVSYAAQDIAIANTRQKPTTQVGSRVSK